MAKST
jgi:hypothetical protein